MVDYDIENELQPVLGPDEKLLWTGRPKRGIVFRGSDMVGIPFSLMWCGFAIFWEYNAITSNTPFFFKLFGIPFVLVGLHITVGRFFADARNRASTIYGITNDRIIIKSGVNSSAIKSLTIKNLTDITFTANNNGVGTIMLGPMIPGYSMMQGTGRFGSRQTLAPPMLELIDDVQAVYQKIIEQQRLP